MAPSQADPHVAVGAGRSMGGDRPTVGGGQAFLIAETSNSSTILSLTSTPPVSSAAFQVMP